MSKAQEIRKKFGEGNNDSDYDKIIAEVERLAGRCKNIIIHHKLSNDTLKKLRKEGFNIEFENNCYFISW